MVRGSSHGVLSPVDMVFGDVYDFEEASARVLCARAAPILYLRMQMVRNLTGYAHTALEPHICWGARITLVHTYLQSQTREDQRLYQNRAQNNIFF
jgi:hypothetical protein